MIVVGFEGVLSHPLPAIVNPRAGGGAWLRQRARLERAFAREGLDVRFLETDAPGAGTALARAALREGARRVIAIGGDGTLHEVANGFFEADAETPIAPDAELGVVPMGSGSDFIRTAGIPADPEASVRLLAAERGRPTDVLRFTCVGPDGRPLARVALNTLSAGATGEALAARNALPESLPLWIRRDLGYLLGGLARLHRFAPRRVEGALDDRPWGAEPLLAVVFANGQAFGNGMRIAPDARLDDGVFEAVWAGRLSPLELAELLIRLPGGSQLAMPAAHHARARAARLAPPDPWLVESDGEQPGTTPLEVRLLPRALRVVRPESPL